MPGEDLELTEDSASLEGLMPLERPSSFEGIS